MFRIFKDYNNIPKRVWALNYQLLINIFSYEHFVLICIYLKFND